MLFESPVAAAKMFPYSVPPPIQGAAAVPVQNLRFVTIWNFLTFYGFFCSPSFITWSVSLFYLIAYCIFNNSGANLQPTKKHIKWSKTILLITKDESFAKFVGFFYCKSFLLGGHPYKHWLGCEKGTDFFLMVYILHEKRSLSLCIECWFRRLPVTSRS